MKHRHYGSIAALVLAGFALPGTARGEVYVELDDSGQFVAAQVKPVRSGRGERVWEPAGIAASASLMLNPNGDLRGDGPPDVAVSPVTGFPRAVWARRDGASLDIVTSFFTGRAWSSPTVIHTTNAADDLDPKLAYTSGGVAVVTWWEKGARPAVRMSYATGLYNWVDLGVISTAGEKAKEPAIVQDGGITIVAYRTPSGIKIVTFNFATSAFGDGPTPFPNEQPGGGGPPTTPLP